MASLVRTVLLAVATLLFAGVCSQAAVASEARHMLMLRTQPPPGWRVVGTPSPHKAMDFYIALKQQNLPQLDTLFTEVSDPLHPRYGQYLTREQILALVAPPKAAVEAVLAALPAGIACVDMGDALRCRGTVAAIETAFQTSLRLVAHSASGMGIIRQIGDFSLPAALAHIVEFVSPLCSYIAPVRNTKPTRVDAGTFFIVPETLYRMYNITEKGDLRSSQGVVEFQQEQWYYLDSDLQTFAQLTNTVINFTKSFGPDAVPGDVSVEATLDVQYVGAVGQGNTNWYWKEEVWMFDFVQNLQNATDRPSVLSLSYAWSEEQQCNSITDQEVCQKLKLTNEQYVARINTEFQKVGLLGITITVASGDSGCHGRTDEECFLQQGKKMYPDYPACSPYVTSVGGTALVNAQSQSPTEPICTNHGVTCATGGTEVTATTEKQVAQISSGGGFSNYAPRPAYQASVVAAYLQNAKRQLPPANTFHADNRGFPDVSALAHAYYIEANGQINGVDGTSCASPVWSGIIGLINAHRIRLGRPVVGFANPLLYQVYNATGGAAFHDITSGNNRCTESGCKCKYGFEAIAGWDAATGLGTPNVGLLIQAIDALDAQREARYKPRV